MSNFKLAYHANCWGSLGGDAVGVTSITNLAYRTFGDMRRAFADIAAAGYEGVELFDGNLLDFSIEDMRSLLADNGLALVATYAGGNFIFDDILPEELARSFVLPIAPPNSARRISSSVAVRSASMASARRIITSSPQRLTG